ncbi:hypothetical protein RYZ27_11005 [Hyphomonas sp. FCG-A18]|uniref:hypothetical protein n=1 Tax=Hyphomonas sp. FCG-A18 TaxID=3080019 RepID=UPI002B2FFC6A|nr:hypothetical protein RYZ27_11005 [Hyphomonas sp. FCG-A18]
MTGTLRIMLAIAALLVAGFGIYYLWAGTLPQHTLKIAGTYTVIVLLTLIVTLITRPAGEKH